MAKTIQEYYQDIINEVKNQTVLENELSGELASYPASIDIMRILLSELNSGSKVAIWRLWAFVIAAIMWIQATLWDKAKTEITELAALANTDKDLAFIYRIKQFEYPGTLIIDPDSYQVSFTPSNPQNRIVEACAIIAASNGISKVLVAKSDGNGGLQKLTNDELSALRVYGSKIQGVGTNVQFNSFDPDILKIKVKVFYDPLAGFTQAQYQALANETVTNSTKNIDFKGTLQENKIGDDLQKLTGYKNFFIETIQARSSTITNLWYDLVDGEYNTVSGYLIPATGSDWEIEALPYNQ